MVKRCLLIFVIAVFILRDADCQEIVPDTVLLSRGISHVMGIYTKAIGGDAHLYNGIEYKPYKIQSIDKGDPYYLSSNWIVGSVNYEGQVYDSIGMLYDLVKDVLVVEHAYSHFKIELANEKVLSFSLGEHQFVNILNSDVTTISQGFYELLSNGKLHLYAKRKKGVFEEAKSGKTARLFLEADKYYIYRNDNYYPVKSKSSLLDILKDQNADIRKFISSNKIRFRRNFEAALVDIVRYYNSKS